MIKALTKQKETEEFESLAEEIINIISQKRFNAGMELLEMRWLIGKEIIESPLYKHGNKAELYEQIGGAVGLGERSVRYCAEFKVKYPDWQRVAEMADPSHKLPVWRDIVRELPSGRREEEKEAEVKCRHCPIHCNG